jgi:hypothetical protein
MPPPRRQSHIEARSGFSKPSVDLVGRDFTVYLQPHSSVKINGLASRYSVLAFPPKAPMRRADGDALTGRDLDPAARHATASENQRMDAVCLDDGEFKIAVIRCCCDCLPHGFIQFCHYQMILPEGKVCGRWQAVAGSMVELKNLSRATKARDDLAQGASSFKNADYRADATHSTTSRASASNARLNATAAAAGVVPSSGAVFSKMRAAWR